MKLLLDTHILLWWFLGSDQLSRAAQEWIEDTENEKGIIESYYTHFISNFSRITGLAFC